MPIKDPDHLSSFSLALAFGTAFLAQLFRQMSGTEPTKGWRLLAGCAGAGLSGTATCGLLIEYVTVSLTLVVAISCVAGWLGANVLLSLAAVIENRLGIRLTPPPEKGETDGKSDR